MDIAIEAQALVRIFRTIRPAHGALGALRSLVAPTFSEKVAVAGVSFSAATGELLALLGPNGAGKSTTIKMLTGILVPTSGHATVAGLVPYRDRERSARNIGAVFGQRSPLWWDLPARESFRILRDIYGVPQSTHAARLRELDAILELSAFWDSRVRHLSLGQRVRCDLAAALLHDPPVLFLDEPTIGMDAVVKEQVRSLLRHEIDQRGKTVLLTTHDMTEVGRLADRVIIVNHGQIVVQGTVDQLRTRFGSNWRIHATLASGSEIDPGSCPDGLLLLRHDGLNAVFGPTESFTDITVHQALARIVERYSIADLHVEESDLEDVMRSAYGYNGHQHLDPDQ